MICQNDCKKLNTQKKYCINSALAQQFNGAKQLMFRRHPEREKEVQSVAGQPAAAAGLLGERFRLSSELGTATKKMQGTVPLGD
jgi:hypothetical protein